MNCMSKRTASKFILIKSLYLSARVSSFICEQPTQSLYIIYIYKKIHFCFHFAEQSIEQFPVKRMMGNKMELVSYSISSTPT